jgi:hypothetical protein
MLEMAKTVPHTPPPVGSPIPREPERERAVYKPRGRTRDDTLVEERPRWVEIPLGQRGHQAIFTDVTDGEPCANLSRLSDKVPTKRV